MKFKNVIPFVFAFVFFQVDGQEKIYSFELKKGDVLDVMLLTQSKAPNAKELFEIYKKTAFPVAFEYSYTPLSGFGVSKLTLGTNNANVLLFGKWGDFRKREAFLDVITKRVPDFHQQRRILFPDFRLTYYEMESDIKFSVNKSKYNAVTAFWIHPKKTSKSFFSEWKAKVVQSGGRVVLTLKNGTSPLGYYYNPDILCMVEWENEAAFKAFEKEHPLSFYNELNNVHQFVI